MSEKKRRIVFAAIAVAMLCGIVSAWTFFWAPAAFHYRMFHDERSFNSVLYHQVQRGDSIASVEGLLGKGRPSPDWAVMLRRAADAHPEGFPDGFHDDDTILQYPLEFASGAGEHYLQFRDGSLINFDPATFAQACPVDFLLDDT